MICNGNNKMFMDNLFMAGFFPRYRLWKLKFFVYIFQMCMFSAKEKYSNIFCTFQIFTVTWYRFFRRKKKSSFPTNRQRFSPTIHSGSPLGMPAKKNSTLQLIGLKSTERPRRTFLNAWQAVHKACIDRAKNHPIREKGLTLILPKGGGAENPFLHFSWKFTPICGVCYSKFYKNITTGIIGSKK